VYSTEVTEKAKRDIPDNVCFRLEF